VGHVYSLLHTSKIILKVSSRATAWATAGMDRTALALEMLRSLFVLQKIANSLPIGHHQKRSLRFKFAIAFGGRIRHVGAHNGPPDL